MSFLRHRVLRERSVSLPLTGSQVVSDITPTGTSLAQNTAAVADPGTNPTLLPLISTSASDSTSTAVAQSSASAANAASSTSSGNQISLGTVIAACVAAAIAFFLAVLLAIYCSKRQKRLTAYSKSRNAANDSSRRRSHLEAWRRMDDGDGGGGGERRERPMIQRAPSEPLGAMFHRTTSNISGEKSLEGQNRESVGTMQHFAKYHPGLAAEMASQGDIMGVDGKVPKPPPVHHFLGRGSETANPVSWDGETVTGHSFISMHSESPLMMATAKATPPATTTSSLHHWESAEVVHVSEVGSDFAEPRELQNPFEDGANSVKSGNKGRNPFFGAQDHPVPRRTLLVDTHEDPFADSNAAHNPSPAIQSLIAALQAPNGQGGNERIVSVQSSVYSDVTGDDGDSAISVAAFPYPPTQIHLR